MVPEELYFLQALMRIRTLHEFFFLMVSNLEINL